MKYFLAFCLERPSCALFAMVCVGFSPMWSQKGLLLTRRKICLYFPVGCLDKSDMFTMARLGDSMTGRIKWLGPTGSNCSKSWRGRHGWTTVLDRLRLTCLTRLCFFLLDQQPAAPTLCLRTGFGGGHGGGAACLHGVFVGDRVMWEGGDFFFCGRGDVLLGDQIIHRIVISDISPFSGEPSQWVK